MICLLQDFLLFLPRFPAVQPLQGLLLDVRGELQDVEGLLVVDCVPTELTGPV